ncbi:hypothetical protein EJ08DRAFT_677206 [Tothia fuscella]|uniref:tRNA (guanine(37)-N1)-methyltransferase n=1 Tax=Tothia fuscella TaxID=1048955 RepID=A0A9P4NVB6_9PEZI|nr:hypothetical protein EJ08DRAFT_677206 [Tothia fuscella]
MTEPPHHAEMLRPPIAHAMRTLDRSFFKKSIPCSAARILDNKQIFPCRSELLKSKDLFELERMSPVIADPDVEMAKLGRKCLLLRPGIEVDDPATHSPTLKALTSGNTISLLPYTLHLTYDYWDYHDIISAILPPSTTEIPSGFSIIGHIAHLNLRSQHTPYKTLIGAILIDKNPSVTTVINKIDDVGAENAFRTFSYEVLAGEDNLNVEVKEEECFFEFDYSKVYWNPRLHGEHKRLVGSFEEGEAVCDLMAGVGPFAIPAGKKKCFVWANDLNPDSFEALEQARKRNKVGDFVRTFNEDASTFASDATKRLWEGRDEREVHVYKKQNRADKKPPTILKTYREPRLFTHFVMNLPASALTFLPSFIGLYSSTGIPKGEKLPLIHVYCFSTKSDDNVAEETSICEEISRQLGYERKTGKVEEGGVEIHDVRDVAPKKRMFCATFRLPEEVAYRVV